MSVGIEEIASPLNNLNNQFPASPTKPINQLLVPMESDRKPHEEISQISNQQHNQAIIEEEEKVLLSSSFDPKTYKNEPHRDKFLGVHVKRRLPASLLPERKIFVGINDIQVPNNMISTSKYNVATFTPMNLFEQFSKVANLYFLLIGILQVIPDISNTNNQPLQFIPLGFIIFVSMVKDAFEDYKRHKSDYEENNKQTLIYKNGGFEKVLWKDLLIGDIVKVEENEYLPADLLLIRTNDIKGTCFIETKNLDGETNLKHKGANKDIMADYAEDKMLEDLHSVFKYERPNPFLYNFVGSMYSRRAGALVGLDHQNFVLRGCSLRNSKWIIGVVTYTGHDTKIMLNSVKSRPKKSKVDKMMNKQIIFVFFSLILVCLFGAIWADVWLTHTKDKLTYFLIKSTDIESDYRIYILVNFGTWVLLLSNFVPISLIVTLEIVKFIQAFIMTKDENLLARKDKIYAMVQSSNLNEELGQINYIFSDKTGTLTCNIMDFKKLSVCGKSYGEKVDMEDLSSMPKVTNVDFKDRSLFIDLNNDAGQYVYEIKETLMFLALCHTIIIEEKNGEICYNAASPDELALVNFARFCGYEFQGIDENNFMNVKVQNEKEYQKYKFLYSLDFTSTRKRHSVLIENEKGQIILYCKGADSVIEKRMSKKNEHKQETWVNLEKYATIGLRTLVLSKRIIPIDEFQEWNRRYTAALQSLEDREQKLVDLQEEIEINLELVAATAIEDKLQDDVGPTIATLKEAGIKVWVLTGDKIETAINIGYACQLLSDNLEKVTIDGNTKEEVELALLKGNEQIIKSKEKEESANFALIVSGAALIYAMKDDIASKVMNIADQCKAVLACRVSPKQKQEIVMLVRTEKPHVTTLAIGDGANDVNMITAAHVGIGIKGKEGQQAARASDYSFGEFKLLKRLLLYYGRESYRKNSNLICFNFYKNIILVMPFFWFGFLDGFSGQLLYDAWIFQFFNIFFASLPIMLYALFDEEFPNTTHLELTKAPPNYLEFTPKHYEPGMKNELFNTKIFWLWMFNGAAHSVIIAFFAIYILEEDHMGIDGEMGFLNATGMMMFSIVVVLSNLKLFVFSKTHYYFTIFFIYGSIAFYLLSFYVFNLFSSLDAFHTFTILHNSAYYYLVSLEIVGFTIGTDFIIWRYFYLSYGDKNAMKVLPTAQIEANGDEKEKMYPLDSKNQVLRKVNTKRHTGYAFSKDEPRQESEIKNYEN